MSRLVFALIGLSNSGKTKLSKGMIDHFSQDTSVAYAPARFSTGEMFRRLRAEGDPIGLKMKEKFFDRSLNAPDTVTHALMSLELGQYASANPLILDGFPRSVPQARYADLQFPGHVPVYLDISDPEMILARSAARGREDDDPEEIRGRIETFRRQTLPLRGYYGKRLITLNASKTPHLVLMDFLERQKHKLLGKA